MVEFRDEIAFAVAVTQPVYPHDSIRGRVLDALRCGESVDEAIAEEVGEREAAITTTALRAFLALIRPHKKPLLAMDCACFAVGESQSRGETIPIIARRHGVSKQAAQQFITRIAADLSLRKASTMQSPEARQQMSVANFRRTGWGTGVWV